MSRDAEGAARAEARQWMEVARTVGPDRHPAAWTDVPGTEAAVIGFHDPSAAVAGLMARWGSPVGTPDLVNLARFAAALAQTEADAWRDDVPDLATHAFMERRFLVGDRILHWAVPWLDIAGRCHGSFRSDAHRARDLLLAIGDDHRPAPLIADGEGIHPPGEDAYGPLALLEDVSPAGRLTSLWGGGLVMEATIVSLGAAGLSQLLDDAGSREDIALWYRIMAARWRRLIDAHPGTARLWRDLARRAEATAEAFAGAGNATV